MNSNTKSPLVSSLLRKNISAPQLVGYAVSSLLGLVIVLVAVRFYCDVRSVSENQSDISRDYLVIQRSVRGLGNLFSPDQDGFTDSDIAEIAGQPWVERIGPFVSADFNVSANLNMAGNRLSTALFFESIPDEFIDNLPSGWEFVPGESKFLPIIVSKDYLALYNFGFAASRGLPQISEEMMNLLPVKISVSGNGKQQWFDARIVGFSSRLNTIAVPEQFMSWANGVFGEGKSLPSRLIVETSSPGDPAISRFLEEKGYDLAGDKDSAGKMSYFLKILTAVVTSIGLVISVLSLAILLLSIWLLLYKNRSRTERLMLLGYSPSSVSARYYRLVGFVNLAVLVVAIGAMFIISTAWQQPLQALALRSSSPLPALLTGIALMVLITAISFFAVYRSVRKSFHPAGSR